MFKNEKKGRLYGIKKDTTFVDNPSIEDTTTKVTRSINFSKSNFLNLGKWILIIVLFLYFGSYTINGFIASNITKDSTEETIIYEYKNQIGSEIVGGNFDFVNSNESLSLLYDKKIYLKYHSSNQGVINLDVNDFYGGGSTNQLLYLNGSGSVTFYDSNDNVVKRLTRYYSFSGINFGTTDFYSSNGMYFDTHNLRFTYNSNFELNRSDYFNSFVYDFNTDTYTLDKDFSYFIINNLTFSELTEYSFTFLAIRTFLNAFFIYDYFEERPIYETTTYTYDIKDINYNWDYKLKQISKFRPLFNSKDLFVNEEFYKYSNLITYEFKNTDIEKENVVNKYKSDERLKILFDNQSITIKGREYNFHLIKDKKDYISYINFDYSKIDMFDENVYNAYMYALENYVNNNNIDDYFIYSKMNFDAKDLLILISFPLQLVVNTLYNFGVLVGIVVLW